MILCSEFNSSPCVAALSSENEISVPERSKLSSHVAPGDGVFILAM